MDHLGKCKVTKSRRTKFKQLVHIVKLKRYYTPRKPTKWLEVKDDFNQQKEIDKIERFHKKEGTWCDTCLAGCESKEKLKKNTKKRHGKF